MDTVRHGHSRNTDQEAEMQRGPRIFVYSRARGQEPRITTHTIFAAGDAWRGHASAMSDDRLHA